MLHPTEVTACATRELVGVADLLDVFERLRADAYPWLLDSALASDRLGRVSLAGADPYLVMRARGSRVELDCRRAVRRGLAPGRRRVEADPLALLRSLWPAAPASAVPATPFIGGAVGYLGYELAAQIEPVAFGGCDDLGLPDVALLFVDRVVALDVATGRLTLHALGFADTPARAARRAEAALDELEGRIRAPLRRARRVPAPARRARPPFAFFDAATYAKAVDLAKQEIAAGNVYQACLTHRIERDFRGDPWELYRRLRRRNPAPFGAYLELPEAAVASSSPERFLRLAADGRVESRPIKGTRRRGADADEDRAHRALLACSVKDRAENLMIVDLVRNDLGRVCETGSVGVPELMAIESYASVFQMVSTVCGQLRDGCDAVDLIRATFPPGSMTGAPKIAAMRILDRLEPVRRGIYSGALGYFDVRGGLDLSVVIRTVIVRDGRAYVHSGGAVVADSNPLDEYRETLDKARPLLAALDEAERGGARGQAT